MHSPDEDAIRKQVARRYRKRLVLGVHLVFTMAFSVYYSITWIGSGLPPLVLFLIAALVLHGLKLIFYDEAIDRAVERELDRRSQFHASQQRLESKLKRDHRLQSSQARLSDQNVEVEWVAEQQSHETKTHEATHD